MAHKLNMVIRNKIKTFSLAAALLLILLVSTYFLINYPTSQPFDYKLTIFPIGNIIMQGQTVFTNITVSYLQGPPKPVSLHVIADSAIMQTSLSNPIGTPEPNEPFVSNLTIHILNSAQSSIYPISITASGNEKEYSLTYNTTVISSQIEVSGIVSTISSDSIYPAKLQFVNQQNNVIYNATLNYPSLSKSSTLQQQATYKVTLPNQETFKVIGTWARLYGPWSSSTDLPEGTFDCGILLVNCTVSEISLHRDFQG